MQSLKAAIESHLHFLIDDFDFSIASEQYEQAMGNAAVIFANQYATIEIVKDRGDILASIGMDALPRREWVEFADIIHFLSGDTGRVYMLPAVDSSATDESQLARIALLMREYCEPIFSGKVSVSQLLSAMSSKHNQETSEFINRFFDTSSSERHDS